MKDLCKVRLAGVFLLVFGLVSAGTFAGSPVKVVVIDAGHGGKDPGAVGASGKQEKEINLKVALLLGEMIQQKYSDVKVVYTRKNDVPVDLYRRAEIANQNHANIFISIHCNAADNRSVYGTETFVMGLDKTNQNLVTAQKENASILLEKNYEENYGNFDPYSPEAYIIFELYQSKNLLKSIELAANIQDEFKYKLNRHCRGVKQAPFLVLYRTTMPSILVELGFLSNKEEEEYLASEKGQRELTNALFNAISKQIEEGKNETNTAATTSNTETKKEISAIDTTDFKSEVLYKVQFLVSAKEYKPNDPIFKNIQDISVEKSGNLCKYASGRCSSYVEASILLAAVKEIGYKDAFIVATKKDGTKISIQEAKELENKN
ncbi:MAG: N-acetylmuramoyl-L-alanine amidase [Lentimicrobiaceae bacterium]|nr:N-acetylmuramoyl-L-alanine amidase [Lentimicrobiaceae bacterium]